MRWRCRRRVEYGYLREVKVPFMGLDNKPSYYFRRPNKRDEKIRPFTGGSYMSLGCEWYRPCWKGTQDFRHTETELEGATELTLDIYEENSLESTITSDKWVGKVEIPVGTEPIGEMRRYSVEGGGGTLEAQIDMVDC